MGFQSYGMLKVDLKQKWGEGEGHSQFPKLQSRCTFFKTYWYLGSWHSFIVWVTCNLTISLWFSSSHPQIVNWKWEYVCCLFKEQKDPHTHIYTYTQMHGNVACHFFGIPSMNVLFCYYLKGRKGWTIFGLLCNSVYSIFDICSSMLCCRIPVEVWSFIKTKSKLPFWIQLHSMVCYNHHPSPKV